MELAEMTKLTVKWIFNVHLLLHMMEISICQHVLPKQITKAL